MKHGLIIGKFMPPHKGHLALINFGLSHCDQLTVLVCALEHEPIPGFLRYRWIKESFENIPNIFIDYTNKELPQGRLSMREISKVWANYLKHHYPKTNIIFSSERYGAYLAEFMNQIEYKNFDTKRNYFEISGSMIRNNPYQNWDYIAPAARGFFTKKISIYGPESKEKTSLTMKLAEKFQTQFISHKIKNKIIKYDDIAHIAENNAQKIEKKLKTANRILFMDTDLSSLKIYSENHFQKIPLFNRKIRKINKCDLIFFCEFSTNKIQKIFLNQLIRENQEHITVKGSRDIKFNLIVEILLKIWPWLKNQLLQ